MSMLFSVGYQPDTAWIDFLVAHQSCLYDVYFANAGQPSGRTVVTAAARQLTDLARLADAGIPLCLLFNANCYGAHALSQRLFDEVGETITRFSDEGAVRAVTVSSVLLAKFVKDNFPALEVRASVNMGIGTREAMAYVADVFDAFYVQRELNRDRAAVQALKTWCDAQGKRLYLLANSGCLNYCPARTFHDNLVAHEAEMVRTENALAYRGLCWKWLAKPENRAQWWAHTNWIAPAEVKDYVGLCSALKLATRINAHPIRILESYLTASYLGPPQALLEPDHSSLFR